MKLDHKDYINILLGIAVAILMFIVVVKIGQEGTQCTLNPLQYGVQGLRDNNFDKEVTCQCNLYSELPSPTLFFTHNRSWFISPEPTDEYTNIEAINFTMFENVIT